MKANVGSVFHCHGITQNTELQYNHLIKYSLRRFNFSHILIVIVVFCVYTKMELYYL